MEKEMYEKTELEIIRFTTQDVVLSSIPFEEDEGERTGLGDDE